MGKVTHCICHDKSFDEILAAARAQGISTLKDIVDSGAAGGCCKMCHPFIEARLESLNPVDDLLNPLKTRV